MKYVPRWKYLLTGGLTGAIYAWNIDLLENIEKYNGPDSGLYKVLLVPGFPLLEKYKINLIADLPIVDSLAVGYSDGVIRLWNIMVFI